jgi:TPR repeat protein
VDRNEAEARRWFQAAAAEGSPDAKEFLATGHHTGSRNLRGEGVGVAGEAVSGQRLIRQLTQSLPHLPALPVLLGVALAGLTAAGAWRQRRAAPAGLPRLA